MRRASSTVVLLLLVSLNACAPEPSGIGWSVRLHDLTCDQALALCGWTLEHPAGQEAAECAPGTMTGCLDALDGLAEPCAEVTVEQYESCILARRAGPCDASECLIELCATWPPSPPLCS